MTSSSTTPRELLLSQTFAIGSFSAYVLSQAYVLSCELTGYIAPNPETTLYCPSPTLVLVFFVAQAAASGTWIKTLFGGRCTKRAGLNLRALYFSKDRKGDDEEADMQEQLLDGPCHGDISLDSTQLAYLPFFIASNVCLTAWSIAWLHDYDTTSQLLLGINMCIQLYSVFLLLHPSRQHAPTSKNWLSHLVAKSGAGIAVLYMWKNWGVIDRYRMSPTAEIVNSALIFVLMTVASGPDPTLGLCILYDLIALAFGPATSSEWYHTFLYIAAAVSAVLGLDAVVRQWTQKKTESGLTGDGPFDYSDDGRSSPSLSPALRLG